MGLVDGAQPPLVYRAVVEARLAVRRLRSQVVHEAQRGMIGPVLEPLVNLALDELLRGERIPKHEVECRAVGALRSRADEARSWHGQRCTSVRVGREEVEESVREKELGGGASVVVGSFLAQWLVGDDGDRTRSASDRLRRQTRRHPPRTHLYSCSTEPPPHPPLSHHHPRRQSSRRWVALRRSQVGGSVHPPCQPPGVQGPTEDVSQHQRQVTVGPWSPRRRGKRVSRRGGKAEEQGKELTERCRRAEEAGWMAIAPSGCLAEAEETNEMSRRREKGEGAEPISSKSCWGLEGLGKATTLL